jgi:cell division protein FtsB
MFNSFGLGEMIIIISNVILLSIPILLVWLLYKTLRKLSRDNEQIEQEVKRLREEIQSLREKMQGNPPK